jgi:hypothetical protein
VASLLPLHNLYSIMIHLLETARDMGEKHGIFFHACKVLLHAVRKEGRRAADFITLKIYRPLPGLNPRTLGPVASTLTTRPLRATTI